MHLIRRAALRAASSSLKSTPRTITTSTPFVFRSKTQNIIAPAVIRRFASDDAYVSTQKQSSLESADGEQSAVDSAIESAESASTYAAEADAVESLQHNAEDAATGAATGAAAGLAFSSRDSAPPSYGEGRETRNFDLEPTNGIYVGNLLFDITAEDLTREFSPFGEVEKVYIAQDARGLSKGFGYVEFKTLESAGAAIEAKHQTNLEGRRLVVNYIARTSRDKIVNPPSKTLFVGNLAFEMTDADLNKLFRDIRNVIDVRVAIDRRTGQPRGFAHADFVDVESAQKALEALQGKELYNRTLRLDYSAGTNAGREGGLDRGGRGGGGFSGGRGGGGGYSRGGDRGSYGDRPQRSYGDRPERSDRGGFGGRSGGRGGGFGDRTDGRSGGDRGGSGGFGADRPPRY